MQTNYQRIKMSQSALVSPVGQHVFFPPIGDSISWMPVGCILCCIVCMLCYVMELNCCPAVVVCLFVKEFLFHICEVLAGF